MDTSKVTSEYREGQWIQIIKDRSASGKTIKAFCQERGISRDSYFYWQHKLRKAACDRMSNAGEISAPIPKGWIQLSDADRSTPSLNIEVNGYRIVVNSQTNPELLKYVCRILRTM